jgi:hypothetical protein
MVPASTSGNRRKLPILMHRQIGIEIVRLGVKRAVNLARQNLLRDRHGEGLFFLLYRGRRRLLGGNRLLD